MGLPALGSNGTMMQLLTSTADHNVSAVSPKLKLAKLHIPTGFPSACPLRDINPRLVPNRVRRFVDFSSSAWTIEKIDSKVSIKAGS